MNRREFEQYLRSNACLLHRYGSGHDIWINAATRKKAPVPRHTVIPRGTVRSACRQFGVPLPPGF